MGPLASGTGWQPSAALNEVVSLSQNDKTFFALVPDSGTADLIARRFKSTIRKYDFHSRPISIERLHLSLRGFGGYTPELTASLRPIAETIRFAPFDITLDRALTFKNRHRHPFVLTGTEGLDGVRAFHRKLTEALKQNGIAPDKEPAFKPHLTLIWDTKTVPEHAIEHPVTWTASEFVLIRSYHGESRYEFLGRWPLMA